MRPTRLELQGFGSFRTSQVIDFDGADLFVLTGATGSGKSTVIDALTFALYGSVPRYDDRRLVAPVITQGLLEARVRLDFTIGERAFTAVRVVRRTKTGATTKEARLEDGDGNTIAANEKELTAKVEELVGLTFDHFTKCVVLPQGDFAEFLHVKPKERNDLLVELLDLDVYRRIATRARVRGVAAEAAATAIATRLEELGDSTEQRRDDLAQRATQLTAVIEVVDADRDRLAELRTVYSDLNTEVQAAQRRVELLTECVPPEGTSQLAGQLSGARSALADAEAAVVTADEAVDAADITRGELGDGDAVRRAVEAHGRHAELTRRLDGGRAQTVTALAGETTAAGELARAHEALVRARHDLEHLRTRHAAAALASGLHAGDDCPVCARPLDADPAITPVTDLTDAEGAVDAAEGTVHAAAAAHQRAQQEHQRQVIGTEAVEHQLTEVAPLLAAHPDRARAEAAAAAIAAADAALASARLAQKSARDIARGAKHGVDALDKAARVAWSALDDARDPLTELDPPRPGREDLAADWELLTTWAQDALAPARDAVKLARERLAESRDEGERLVAAHVVAAREVGVTVQKPAQARDDLQQALSAAQAEREKVEGDLARSVQLREDLATARAEAAQARDLGKRLDARNFEAWLLNRALKHLVIGASSVLRDLSDGAYSLDLDESNGFTVVDHRNADEVRSARTLSGGETFLASLSLALALADHVADLAAQGSARLDALFLDEGFGTLDEDTLETVAVAIEELGARGRMVGIVTHVRDLAERLPVRFEITKTPAGSQVEKVLR